MARNRNIKAKINYSPHGKCFWLIPSLNFILVYLKMDETLFAFKICPSKILRRTNLWLMDTKLNILIISLYATIIMLLGFTLWFHHRNSKILCNSKYSIRIILQFSCMCFMRYDMEITWKLFISLKNLICIWVSEFVHKEFAYSQRSVMSVFSPVHSLIHPLFLLSTCILWAS